MLEQVTRKRPRQNESSSYFTTVASIVVDAPPRSVFGVQVPCLNTTSLDLVSARHARPHTQPTRAVQRCVRPMPWPIALLAALLAAVTARARQRQRQRVRPKPPRALVQVRPNSLVRFRCMIQDMRDPEFYMGSYMHRDPLTGESREATTKYLDMLPATGELVCETAAGGQARLGRQAFCAASRRTHGME